MTTSPVPTISDEQIAEIEALAEKAIPGPWFADSCECDRYVSPEPNGETAVANVLANDFDDESGRWFSGSITEATHKFMAMANPEFIAALIARLRAAEKDAARYRFIRNYDDGDSVERALINPNYTPVQIRMGAGLDNSIDTAMSEAKP